MGGPAADREINSAPLRSVASKAEARLAFWREWVIPMGVATSDGPVPPVDEQFGSLVPSDFPSPVDRLLLGVVDRRWFRPTRRLDGPALIVGHDMLILL